MSFTSVVTFHLQKSSFNLRESKNGGKDQSNRLSLNNDNKYTGQSAKNVLPTSVSNEERHSEREDKDVGTEKDKHNSDKNGALHQCISELAASIASNEDGFGVADASAKNVHTTSGPERPPKSTSHFVTVIEVKESKINMDQNNPALSMDHNADNCVDNTPSTFSSFERKPSAPPLSPSLSSSSHAAGLLEANKKKMPPR